MAPLSAPDPDPNLFQAGSNFIVVQKISLDPLLSGRLTWTMSPGVAWHGLARFILKGLIVCLTLSLLPYFVIYDYLILLVYDLDLSFVVRWCKMKNYMFVSTCWRIQQSLQSMTRSSWHPPEAISSHSDSMAAGQSCNPVRPVPIVWGIFLCFTYCCSTILVYDICVKIDICFLQVWQVAWEFLLQPPLKGTDFQVNGFVWKQLDIGYSSSNSHGVSSCFNSHCHLVGRWAHPSSQWA